MTTTAQKSKTPSKSAAFPVAQHNHGACKTRALAHAVAVCARRGVRLTPLRRRVLELIWTSHKPVGAYDILDRLAREREGAAPPTVYRVLHFLAEHALVHRIESLNAYVGCAEASPGNAGVSCTGGTFLICRDCGRVREIGDRRIDTLIERRAAAAGFVVDARTIEIEGLCSDCQPAAGGARS